MQITLYIDTETEVLAKAAAASQGVSVSRWVCQAIQDKTLTQWPQAVRDAGGAFPDWPLVVSSNVPDAPRETFD